MKKVVFMIAMLAMTLTASAQFEKGKTFIGASLTGLDLSYNGSKGFSFGVSAQAGQFIQDNWLLYVVVGYDHIGKPNTNTFNIGVGGRYYILQNGIFLGANAKYAHATGCYNDVKPAIEIGYSFFIGRVITIEPSIYYEQSFKSHSDFSTVGLKIGIGLYHPKNKVKESITEAFK